MSAKCSIVKVLWGTAASPTNRGNSDKETSEDRASLIDGRSVELWRWHWCSA